MKNLHHAVFVSHKVINLSFQAVTHPFTHQSQRCLTSLESEFEKKRRVWSMPLQYGLRWFRIPSRFPSVFPYPYAHIPYLTQMQVILAPYTFLYRPFFERNSGMWGNSNQRTLESKDPETSTECARPSRPTSLTRIFWYWLRLFRFSTVNMDKNGSQDTILKFNFVAQYNIILNEEFPSYFLFVDCLGLTLQINLKALICYTGQLKS